MIDFIFGLVIGMAIGSVAMFLVFVFSEGEIK
jgi:hypothetical protein